MAALREISKRNLQRCRYLFSPASSARHEVLAYLSSSSHQKASMTPVGFIGLGNMGGHMAKNLLKQGYPLIVNDVYPEATSELQDLGAVVADSAAEVAEKTDRIITMLPSSPNVVEAYTSSNGILSNVRKGALLIDSSTIDPSVAKEISRTAEDKGAVYMDAPVSGGVNAARDALLTFMVGGKAEEFEAAKELLQCMGKNVVNTGQVGTGQAAKICNNMMLGITMIGTSETMNLGIRSHRKTRVKIEQTFGLLKRKFPCLSLGMRVSSQKACIIIKACCVLYNLSKQFGQPDLEVADAEGAEDEGGNPPYDETNSSDFQRPLRELFLYAVLQNWTDMACLFWEESSEAIASALTASKILASLAQRESDPEPRAATELHAKLGLDPKMLAKILNSSSGRSWSSDTYNPVPGVLEGVPSGNQYKGGFSSALMTKDLGLAQNASTSTKSPTPLGSLAHQIYRIMCSKGYSLKDFSSAYQYLREEE